MLVSHIAGVVEGHDQLIRTATKEKYAYQKGVRTEVFESVTLECVSEKLGKVQVILPYADGLKELIDQKIPFGEKFSLDDCGTFNDVSITVYNGFLNVKFMMSAAAKF